LSFFQLSDWRSKRPKSDAEKFDAPCGWEKPASIENEWLPTALEASQRRCERTVMERNVAE